MLFDQGVRLLCEEMRGELLGEKLLLLVNLMQDNYAAMA